MIPLTIQSRHHHDILARFAREHGVTLLDVRPLLESDPSFFLPGDGHFTGRGARTLAERVAAFLRQRAGRQPGDGASARASLSSRSTWNLSASASPATWPSASMTRYSAPRAGVAGLRCSGRHAVHETRCTGRPSRRASPGARQTPQAQASQARPAAGR
jgi:hypothetical protein